MNDDRDAPPPCQHAPCLGHFAATGDDRCILAAITRRLGRGEWITALVNDPGRVLATAILLTILAAGAFAAVLRVA